MLINYIILILKRFILLATFVIANIIKVFHAGCVVMFS